MLLGNNILYSAFQEAKSENNGSDLFLDEAPGKIHRFHIASEEREDEVFWVRGSRQKKISLIADASRVIRNIPKKFRLRMICCVESDMALKNLKAFLIKRGRQSMRCLAWKFDDAVIYLMIVLVSLSRYLLHYRQIMILIVSYD